MKRYALLWVGAALFLGSAVVMAGQAPIVPNSLHDAKVGEWTLYKTPNGYEQKHTVVKVDGRGPDATVVVRIDNIYNGEVVHSVEVHHEAGEARHPFVLPDGTSPQDRVSVSGKNVTLKGKTVPATDVKATGEEDGTMEWTLSEDIPVFGLIRQSSDEGDEYELIDFGVN